MKVEKSHHYLPRGYLKSFANKDGKINQHFKYSGEVHPATPKSVGFENHLYRRQAGEVSDTAIEKYFHQIEDIIPKLLSKLAEKEANLLKSVKLKREDIEIILWFFSELFWRQRKAVKSYNEFEQNLVSGGKLPEGSKNNLYARDLHQNIAEFYKFLIENYIVYFLFSMKSEFLLGESGVVTEMDKSKSVEPIGMFLPLTPRIVLSLTRKDNYLSLLTDQNYPKDYVIFNSKYCSEEFVDSLNHWSVSQSERYYYSRPK